MHWVRACLVPCPLKYEIGIDVTGNLFARLTPRKMEPSDSEFHEMTLKGVKN